MSGSLTPQQIERYRSDGFLLPIRVTGGEQAGWWRAAFETLEERYHDADLPHPFVDYFRSNLHVVSADAARIAHHPAIVDAVESVIGPDVLLWMAELIVKEPRSPKVLTMHQDMTYWGLAGADGLVTAWIALTDATVDNGAMRYVRGSHLRGQVGHHDTFGQDNLLSRGQEVDVEHDPADEVAVELRAGEMSLHHGLMFHGSGPNHTDGRRVGLVLRYVSPAVEQAVAVRDYAMVVRGVNRSRHLLSVAVPMSDFAPDAVSLHAEMWDTQAEALGAEADEQFSYGR